MAIMEIETVYYCTKCKNQVVIDHSERFMDWIMCYCMGTYPNDNDYPETWVIVEPQKISSPD